jgi:hypothetical protein
MNRCLILLAALAAYAAAPEGTSPTAEMFGDWSAPVPVASLNTGSNDMYAILSKNELTVYFASDRPGGVGLIPNDDLWFATRESVDAPWGDPHNMREINSAAADSLPMLSYDEHVMFFQSTRPGGCGKGDIWMTRRRDNRSQEWESPTNLGCVLNTDANETAPAFFENPETEEVTLFYGSDRGGPSTDYDVYASVVGEDGYFGLGVVVPEFSSPRRDTRIFVRTDGLEAFITSNRDYGTGAIDIWNSTRQTLSDPWSTPLIDLPSPVNSSCDDGSPSLSRDGTTLYFFSTRISGGGCGTRDIWSTTREKIQQENNSHGSVARLWKLMLARLSGSPLG